MTLAVETAPAIGSFFEGRYEILADLGGGSFGRVFKARQLSTGQLVAVKVMRMGDDGDAADLARRMQRFRRETRVCAELSHPNIVRLIDSGETSDGRLYAAFEFVPGITLKDVLAVEGKLAMAEAVHLMAQILDALSCAHACGIVHRDLKPENVMITKTGARRNALVLDFGLGGFAREAEARALPRLTASHELLGTPCYAAPEQLRGEAPSPRSDLYSWGLMLLECLTGDLPVHGASAQEVILKQLGPEPVAIPAWLRNHPLGRVLELVTAKRAEKRDIPIERVLHLLTTIGVGELPEVPGTPVDDATVGRERRQLTIVCCRLTISASRDREPDVEEVDQLLQARRRALAEQAARAGGTVATSLADRVFLVFGYPQAREDDARRAARLALAIASEGAGHLAGTQPGGDLQVGVRIGVHTGLVIVSDLRQGAAPRLHELTGVTPQIASQLVDRARAGEVLVSFDTQGLLRHEFDFEPAGECVMSELSRPLPVFRLTSVRRGAMGTESRIWAREMPLVGRAAQLQQLRAGWASACAGRSGVVVITGEAGIGKSRLVHELRQQVGRDAWLECSCAPENQTTALRPVIDLLLAMDRSTESLLTRVGLDLREHLPLFAALLAQPLDPRYEPLHLSPERQKELTLHALVQLLFRRAEESPIVFVVGNLHWADPTTIELLTLLIQELRAAHYVESVDGPKLYLLFTTRPELVPPWSAEDVAFLPLQRLARSEVEEMVRVGLATEGELPPTLVEQVVQRTDGVPLFVEEITRLMLESTREGDNRFSAASVPAAVEIPASLRDLLTARLDSVSPAASDTAQLAAVLGREFRFEVLQAVSPKDAALLRADIAELGRAGLVFHRRAGGSDSYVFRHALLRDAAYDALTRPARQSLHLRVANVLERQFSDVQQKRPEILALHFEKGGQLETAVEYWHRAGDGACKRAAYVEAVQQLERGLGLLQTVQGSSKRMHQEVELLTTLGTALFSTQGYAAEEVQRTFALAWELCEQLGDDIPLKVLWGIWSARLASGDREGTDKLVPRFRRFAAQTEDPVSVVMAQTALGTNAFWRGDLVEAEEHLLQARQLYGTDAFERFALEYGYDPGLYAFAFGTFVFWQLGYPDQAEALRREMLALVERSRNPYSISLAIGFGLTLLHDRGETESVLEMADRLIALATEQRLYFWLAPANCCRGAALLQRGDTEAAIAQIRQGLDLYKTIGVLSSYAYYLTYLAAAYLQAGRAGDGLQVIDESLSLCETHLARFYESEALRLKGELLLLQADTDNAETSLRQALAVAERNQAKSYELRAAMSLSRLWRGQGKNDAARSLLGGVYGWFTEGFETADLRAARALLVELGGARPHETAADEGREPLV